MQHNEAGGRFSATYNRARAYINVNLGVKDFYSYLDKIMLVSLYSLKILVIKGQNLKSLTFQGI